MKGTMVIRVHFIQLQLNISDTCCGYVTRKIVLIWKKKKNLNTHHRKLPHIIIDSFQYIWWAYIGGGWGVAYRVFSLAWPVSIQIYIIGTKESIYVRKEFNPRGLVWNTNMAAVSLFWNTNMAAVTSCENALYVGKGISSSLRYVNR